jgi:hypothetical protein
VIVAVLMESSEYLNSEFIKGFTEGWTKEYARSYVEGYKQSSGGLVVPPPTYIVHGTLGTFLGSFVAALLMAGPVLSRVLNWVTKTEGSLAYIGRSIPILIAALILVVPVAFLPDDYFYFKTPITAFTGSFCYWFVITLAFAMVCSWVLVVVPVLFILLLMGLFRAAEFVAVRVAENPKGPQYALSFLLAVAGAGVSYFT